MLLPFSDPLSLCHPILTLVLDATRHPTTQEQPGFPNINNYLAQNIHCTKVENPNKQHPGQQKNKIHPKFHDFDEPSTFNFHSRVISINLGSSPPLFSQQ